MQKLRNPPYTHKLERKKKKKTAPRGLNSEINTDQSRAVQSPNQSWPEKCNWNGHSSTDPLKSMPI